MRVKPEPSRSAKSFSLLSLTIREHSVTRTQVHSVISPKSIRNIKPQHTEGTEISVSYPGSSSTFIEHLLQVLCVGYTANQTGTPVTFQWLHEQSPGCQ